MMGFQVGNGPVYGVLLQELGIIETGLFSYQALSDCLRHELELGSGKKILEISFIEAVEAEAFHQFVNSRIDVLSKDRVDDRHDCY